MAYFDNAATTPPLPFEKPPFEYGNVSSPHKLGITLERFLHFARNDFAKLLSCNPNEIIFTSGGTESNNLGLLGYAFANRRQKIKIYAAPTEHPSVVEPIRFAEEIGIAEKTNTPNFKGKGIISMSQVSHETGDIFDVSKTAEELKKENPDLIIHVDGVQGFCKEKFDLTNIDMYSFSGHKIHAPLGVGGLFLRNGIRILPLMYGGGQENGIRAGTENIFDILHMLSAAQKLNEQIEENYKIVHAVRAELAELTCLLPNVYENRLSENVSPYILNLSFEGIKGETLVHLLSEKGIYVSMGAACRSRKKQKSTLEIMGFSKERAESAVRFSFSHLNTTEEAIKVKEIIINCVSQLRRVLGSR